MLPFRIDQSNSETTIADVKEAVKDATKLPPEALKVFFRGRPRADDDKLVLLGVKQFSKLVLVGNPTWNPPTPAASDGGPKTKLDILLESIRPLEEEARSTLSSGEMTTRDKVKLTELLTQKLLQLDALEVEGEGRERRKKAIQNIEKLCSEFDKLNHVTD